MEQTDLQTCESRCPCMDGCPLEGALGKLGGKWKLRILCALLQDGPTRYSALRRKVGGITNTMLASSLRELEQDGLVVRRLYEQAPVRVEYTATRECRSLMPILMHLAQWEIEMRRPVRERA